MRSFKDLTGTELEEWLEKWIVESLNLNKYYPSPGNITLDLIDPNLSNMDCLEIDGIAIVGTTAVIFEITSQSSDSKRKVEKFCKNATRFLSADKEKQADLFNIVQDKDDYIECTQYKFVFIGISKKFRSDLTPSDFALYANISSNLAILDYQLINYFYQTSDLINQFIKSEFLNFLNIEEEPDAAYIVDNYISLLNKYVTESSSVKADVYTFKMKVDKLLKISKVPRFNGIPLYNTEDNNYQRLLSKRKIKQIATSYLKDDKRRVYPTNIIAILDCTESEEKIYIPSKFGAMEIVDGQHRLFSYAHNSISDETRSESEILVTGIKFPIDSKELFSATVFCDINTKQSKVNPNLIYILNYDVRGVRDFKSVAAKILVELNKRGSLKDHFFTNPLRKENNKGLKL